MFKFSGKTEAAPETKGKEAPVSLPFPNPASILKMKPSEGGELLRKAVEGNLLIETIEPDETYE